MKAAKKNVNVKHLLEDYRCTPITLNHITRTKICRAGKTARLENRLFAN